MGELLQGRHRQHGLSSARQLHGSAVASVVALQAQSQAAAQGRELSTLAPVRALRARTLEQAWARRVVDEGVRTCPRAGCGRSACPVVCPVKAGMFSRRQTCRGRSQSPVVWIAEVMETETLKPIDKVSPGEATSHRAVTTVNALWPRKCVSPRAEPSTGGRRPHEQPKTDRYGCSPRRGGSDSTRRPYKPRTHYRTSTAQKRSDGYAVALSVRGAIRR